MDKQSQSRAPLIVAIVLLLLPVLYVGSYAALVQDRYEVHEDGAANYRFVSYRVGGDAVKKFFWPVEQIDCMAGLGKWLQVSAHR